MKATGPFNLIAGQETDLVAPDDQAYTAVVVYNNTGSVIGVSWNGNSDIVQPLTANVYKFTQSNTEIALVPVSLNPVDTYLGTVTATWYLAQDAQPQNYPQPLIPFPGGASLIAQIGLRGNVFGVVNDITATSKELFTGSSFIFALPSGTGFVNFKATSLSIGTQAGGSGTNLEMSLVGVQTGTVYDTIIAIPGIIQNGTALVNPDLTFKLINPIDQTFYLTIQLDTYVGGLVNASFVGPLTLSASQGNPPSTDNNDNLITTPLGVTSSGKISVLNTDNILPALTNGKNYILFGVDCAAAAEDVIAVCGENNADNAIVAQVAMDINIASSWYGSKEYPEGVNCGVGPLIHRSENVDQTVIFTLRYITR